MGGINTGSKLSLNLLNCIGLIEQNNEKQFMSMMWHLGGWPVLHVRWIRSKFDWIQTMIELRKIGYSFNYLIGFEISPSYVNIKNRIIQVRCAYFSNNHPHNFYRRIIFEEKYSQS